MPRAVSPCRLPSVSNSTIKVRVLPAPEKEVDALYVFTEDTFKAWHASVFEAKGGYDPTNSQHRMVKEALNGAATTLEIDSAARISLPEADRAKRRISTREVRIVGTDDHLEVWDRATHEARKSAHDGRPCRLLWQLVKAAW